FTGAFLPRVDASLRPTPACEYKHKLVGACPKRQTGAASQAIFSAAAARFPPGCELHHVGTLIVVDRGGGRAIWATGTEAADPRVEVDVQEETEGGDRERYE